MENAQKISQRCAAVLSNIRAKTNEPLIQAYWMRGNLKAVSYETFKKMVLDNLNQNLHERFRKMRPL